MSFLFCTPHFKTEIEKLSKIGHEMKKYVYNAW